ncbi:trypsin-like serine protease [Nocardia sp. CA2R105]|uniref:S1 family peptidase n=1 Tax=Nocardia coffeae TaxID=2873381 RepID=UPI001CA6B333|nr:trypsin-like serine protease [Nocardia coffeae]MBY8854988.1 trypsin-like serine protease [Nocardia coffeae]
MTNGLGWNGMRRNRARCGLAAGIAAAVAILPSAGVAQAMSNGTPVTDPNTAPWVATIDPVGTGSLFDTAECGGALIGPDRVVTAGHCVADVDPNRMRIHLDARVLSKDPGIERGVRGIVVAPGYTVLPTPIDPTVGSASARNDLAVILLDKSVPGVPVLPIAPSRPAPGTTVSLFAHGNTGKIVGFEDPDYRDDTLHRGDLTVVSQADCAAGTPATVDAKSVMCAQDTATRSVGTCWRDSGSPAVTYRAGRAELAGLFSFGGETLGKPCSPTIAAFADATAFQDWLLGSPGAFEPFPTGKPVVRRLNGSLHCDLPQWDPVRGRRPTSTSVGWSTLGWMGTLPVMTPIPGADSADIPNADVAQRKADVVCVVTATNFGGRIQTWSDAVHIAG